MSERRQSIYYSIRKELDMSHMRFALASALSCALLLAGLLIGSTRSGRTDGVASGRQPFAERLTLHLKSGESSTPTQGEGSFTVPPGKTLVLENVSYFLSINAGQRPQVSLTIMS